MASLKPTKFSEKYSLIPKILASFSLVLVLLGSFYYFIGFSGSFSSPNARDVFFLISRLLPASLMFVFVVLLKNNYAYKKFAIIFLPILLRFIYISIFSAATILEYIAYVSLFVAFFAAFKNFEIKALLIAPSIAMIVATTFVILKDLSLKLVSFYVSHGVFYVLLQMGTILFYVTFIVFAIEIKPLNYCPSPQKMLKYINKQFDRGLISDEEYKALRKELS